MLSARQGLSRLSKRNRSPIDTPVNLGNQICVGKIRKIRGVVDWCTKIPLDTPLARLVTADPAFVVIEHDILQGMNGLVVRSKTYKSRLVRTGWQGSAF